MSGAMSCAARRIAIALALILASALLGAPSSEATKGAASRAILDPSFGTKGLLRLTSEPSYTAAGVAGPDGDLLVSGGRHIQVLGPRGGVGGSFGGAGSLDAPPAAGDTFELGGFAVDGSGRLLIVGASVLPQAENPSPRLANYAPAFRPASIRILRFLPDGHLDPSFGQAGVVETDLGLPPPLGLEGLPLGTHAALIATGIAIDPQGRIVVTGGAVTRLGESCERDTPPGSPVSAGFVARFAEDGELDQSFADGGLFGGRDLAENPLGAEATGSPLVSRSGAITYLSTGAYVCEGARSHLGIGRLTPEGHADAAFGNNGALVGSYRTITETPDGSVVALTELPRHEKQDFRARLIRISPAGKLDPSFGNRGKTILKLPPAYATTLDSLAVDPRGMLIVGGTLETARGRSLLLMRVSAKGVWDHRFGPHGRVATPVPRLTQFGVSDQFFDPRGGMVTVHQIAGDGASRSGLVVARYRPGV